MPYYPPAPASGGYNLIQEEGVSQPARTTIDFVGAGVTASDVGGETQVSIPGGAGSDPTQGLYAPGTFTMITGKYVNMGKRLQLTTTQRASIAGTSRLSVRN